MRIRNGKALQESVIREFLPRVSSRWQLLWCYGKIYGITISLFYNFLYLNALCEEENRKVSDKLIEQGYIAFTDLATRSLNCQARSAAIYVSLVRNGLISEVKDIDSYLRLFCTKCDGCAIGAESYENVQIPDRKGNSKLLSPVVLCTFSRSDTERLYAEKCSCLTNKRTQDNFLDIAGESSFESLI